MPNDNEFDFSDIVEETPFDFSDIVEEPKKKSSKPISLGFSSALEAANSKLGSTSTTGLSVSPSEIPAPKLSGDAPVEMTQMQDKVAQFPKQSRAQKYQKAFNNSVAKIEQLQPDVDVISNNLKLFDPNRNGATPEEVHAFVNQKEIIQQYNDEVAKARYFEKALQGTHKLEVMNAEDRNRLVDVGFNNLGALISNSNAAIARYYRLAHPEQFEAAKAFEDWNAKRADAQSDKAAYYSGLLDEDAGYTGKDVVDIFNEKGLGAAIEYSSKKFTESAPITAYVIGMNAIGAGAVANAQIFTGTTEQKYRENESRADMSENAKLVNALGYGTTELLFEGVLTSGITNLAKDYIKQFGKEEAKSALKKTMFDMVKNGLKKTTPINEIILEGVGEGLTQLSQNLIDKYTDPNLKDKNVMDGVVDATAIGSIGGSGMAVGTVGGAIVNQKNNKAKVDELEQKKSQIESSLTQVSPQTAEVLNDEIGKIQEQQNDIIIKDRNVLSDKMTEEKREETKTLSNTIDDLQSDLDNTQDETVKEVLQNKIDVIQNQIDEIYKAADKKKFFQGSEFTAETGLPNGWYLPEEIEKIKPESKTTSPVKGTDEEIEKRMLELEDSGMKFDSKEQHEFNSLEKEMEKRERYSVFNVPLNEADKSLDALAKKEKDQPNGYGSFIEKRDIRESKEIIERYSEENRKNLSDKELMNDFSDALRGNPTTWYADGLKLRESAKEAADRGIAFDRLLKTATDVYIKDGYNKETAQSVVLGFLEPIFKDAKTEQINNKTNEQIEPVEQRPDLRNYDTGGDKPFVSNTSDKIESDNKTNQPITPEEKSNLESIAAKTGDNFRVVQNIYNKYGEGKPLSEITEEDYNNAVKKREQTKEAQNTENTPGEPNSGLPNEPVPPSTDATNEGGKPLKLAERILNSDEVSEDIKEGLKKEGTTYIPESIKVNHDEAIAYVDAFEQAGEIDKAMNNVMDVKNGMTGISRGIIGSEIFKRYAALSAKTESLDKKREYDAKAAKIASFAANQFRAAGQEINAAKVWKDLISKTPEGAVAELTNQYKEQNEKIIEPDLKNIRAAKKEFEELLKSDEGQEVIRKEVEKEINKRSETLFGKVQKEKISNFFDSLLINTAGKSFDATLGLPVAIWNNTIKAVKEAVLLGASTANAIKAGIDYVNSNHTGAWKEKEFELMMKKGISSLNIKRKVVVNDKNRAKILDAWEKRLKKLSSESRKKLLSNSIDELNNSGALSEERFKDLYAEAMGLPIVSEEVKLNIFNLIDRINKADKATDEYKEAFDNKGDLKKTKSNWDKSLREARYANEELSSYFRNQKDLGQTLTTILQGNLLTPMSLITNVYSNTLFQPLRFMSGGIASISDYILSQGAKYTALGKFVGKERTINIINRTKGVWKGFIPGVKEGLKDARYGLTSEEITQRDLSNKLQPLKSAADLWATYHGKNKMSASAQVNAWAETLFGLPAEGFFRLLNLGDKPFRRMAEMGRTYEIAKQKGLEGTELAKFLEFPDAKSQEEINKAGDEATFQGDNNSTKAVTFIGNMIKGVPFIGDVLHFLFKSLFPYVKTPTNIIGETLSYALPPVTLSKSIYYAAKGDRKKSLENFGKAVVGSMMWYAAQQLLLNGLITGSAGDEDEPKERSIQYENVPPNSMNISALNRGLSGQGFEKKDDDVWINYTKMGVPGSIIAMHADMGEDKTLDQVNAMNVLELGGAGVTSLMKTTFEQSYLSGSQTLLNAISEGGNKADKLMVNMANTISSVAYPNTLAVLSKSSDENIRSTKAETLSEELANVFKNKMFMGSGLPSKITLWGEKVSNAPAGQNKYAYNLFDITKHISVDTENFGYKIYDKWNTTKEGDWLPSFPKQEITINSEKIKLTPAQYEQYLMYVGKERKALVEPYVNSEDWENDTDEEKISVLKQLYSEGQQNGKYLMIESDPALLKLTEE